MRVTRLERPAPTAGGDDAYVYTPERVRALLTLYPYLLDSAPPREPRMEKLSQRVFGPGGWREEAAAKRADIYRALVWLEGRDWRAAYCLRARYAVGLPLRDIAGYLARHDGGSYHLDTIRRWSEDGLALMAGYLNNG